MTSLAFIGKRLDKDLCKNRVMQPMLVLRCYAWAVLTGAFADIVKGWVSDAFDGIFQGA